MAGGIGGVGWGWIGEVNKKEDVLVRHVGRRNMLVVKRELNFRFLRRQWLRINPYQK